MIAIIIAFAAGICATTQASVNAETRRIIKSPYLSAAINFVFSIVVLVPVILILEHNLYLPLAEIATYPIWIWIGGCCGPLVIITSVFSVPKLGSARHMMLACTAQIIAGLLIDQFGLFGSMRIGMDLYRTLGAVMVISGICISSVEREERAAGGANILLYTMLSLLNGIGAAVQIAANGSLNRIVGHGGKTALISMCVGLTTTVIVMIIISIAKGTPDAIFEEGIKFHLVSFHRFMLYGGALAVIVVGGNAISAGILGTAAVNILNLAGMLATGMWLDAIGFLGIEKKPVTKRKVLGIALIIGGAALISFL